MRYLLAIDEGTTGTTAIIMDQNLNLIAEASCDFPQHFPQPGWVEHDLQEVWDAVKTTIQKVVSKVDAKQIAAIGITNQRETLCFWDKKSSKPLSRAIVWQDRRTAKECDALKKRGLEKKFNKATGLLLDPYFSGTKAAWALKNWPEVKRAEKEKRLAIGTMDSFLIAQLTGGAEHVTEPSNASRTLCFHLTKHIWDDALCKIIGVKKELWPEVKPSTGLFGKTKGLGFLPDGIPITGVLGDQQSALLGQACIEPGQAKCTYGTGAFLLMNTGKKPAFSKHRLLTTIAWALDKKNYTYALEGSTFIAGAAVQWVRDSLGLIKDSAEIETLASQVTSAEGAVFVPALTGLGAPYWNPNATGMLTGITRGTTRAHLARAVLEGIAFQITDLLTAMQKDLGKKKLLGLNVDGGASANNLLMQFQSDILGVELRRPQFLETTSLGAIFAAGLGAGIWSNLKEIEKTWKKDRTFQPAITPAQRKAELMRWTDAVKRVNLK
jgi:glycerol kinase